MMQGAYLDLVCCGRRSLGMEVPDSVQVVCKAFNKLHNKWSCDLRANEDYRCRSQPDLHAGVEVAKGCFAMWASVKQSRYGSLSSAECARTSSSTCITKKIGALARTMKKE